MSDSLITKKAIATGIKELTKKKSFDKITVSDITEICGLNRQTFYYHFQDKYELVNWIYYNEAISLVINDLAYENSAEKIYMMLSKMKSEDYFYVNTLKASVKNEFEAYLFKVISELFCDVIEKIAANSKMEENEIRFIAEFYSYGIVGLIISWAQNGMKESPEYITTQLRNLAYGTEKFATARYQEKYLNKQKQD
ncbi:MAG TPA: dihydroxyacetone kinase transcriptional activator DhaS [Mobilitalea sp.]|nr:dihydroxyacetone kinase transcriptional activator DhaS [Mobilitalea sp.]